MLIKHFTRWSLALLTLLMVTACQSEPPFECTDALGCVQIGPDEPIKLAALQVLSGDIGPIGLEQLQVMKIAAEDYDNQLLGHPLELLEFDSGCSKEGGTTAALQATADPQVVAIIGTTCSGAGINASRIMSEAGLSMVSSSNTAPSLTAINNEAGENWQAGYFRTAPSDLLQGRAAATFAFEELGIRQAATVNDGDTYSYGLAQVFEQVFTELGGEIVSSGVVNKGDTDAGPLLEALQLAEAELVFLPIQTPEALPIVRQAKESPDMAEVVLLAAEGLYQNIFIEPIGADGIGMYFVTPTISSGEEYETFSAKYQAAYNEELVSALHANSYDAAIMIFEAIKVAAVSQSDGTLYIGRQALRDALYATTTLPGLSGTLTCDSFGDCSGQNYSVLRWDAPVTDLKALSQNVIYIYDPNQQ